MGFQLRNLERLGGRVDVSIPKDDRGSIGRECPDSNCLGYFKVRPGTGLTGRDIPCHCPYCGHSGDSNTFLTADQVEYVQSIALQSISNAIQRDLKQLEFNHRPSGSFGLGISLRVTPGRPIPIRHYRDKSVETDIVCAKCTLNYAIFGLFAFCPDCGEHNSEQILHKNLELIAKQLDLAKSLTDLDLRHYLIEDALENCVSAFDGFGRESCRVRAHRSNDSAAATHLSFQNLDRANRRLLAIFGVDLSSTASIDCWLRTQRAFLRRHVLVHRSGVIDEQYKHEASDDLAVVGRRLSITPEEVTVLIDDLRVFGRALVDELPLP
jgi:hypothetical protein